MKKATAMKMPDDRNVGGKHFNDERMFNHQKALIQTKPQIKVEQPRKHVDHGKKDKRGPLYKREQEYDQVIKTFAAINNQKTQLDRKLDINQPKKIGSKYSKALTYEQQEHERRLKAQKQRIQEVGSQQQRKKDVHNPVSHPTYLFRREEKKKDATIRTQLYEPPRTTIGAPINTLVRQLQKQEKLQKQLLEDPMEEEKAFKIKERQIDQEIELIKKEKLLNRQSKVESKIQSKQEDFIFEIPEVPYDTDQDYNELKVKLVLLIVKYRIYKKVDLEVLLNRSIINNPQLNEEKIGQIFNEIQDDLDS